MSFGGELSLVTWLAYGVWLFAVFLVPGAPGCAFLLGALVFSQSRAPLTVTLFLDGTLTQVGGRILIPKSAVGAT